MKAGWSVKRLEDCLERYRVPAKIQRKHFLGEGAFPIVSQEADFINGYWNDVNDLCVLDRPVVIFGDHTRVLKYVNFDFVVGADGVKVLMPKEFLDAKFLYYFLASNRAPSLGYARHFRHIAQLELGIPPLDEQKRIVAVLDEAFEGLDLARANAEANLADARELLENGINSLMESDPNAVETVLGELCSFENGDRGKNYPGRKAFVPSGVPFINAGHLLNGLIDWAEMNYIPLDHFHRLSNGKVRRGDLLFCLRGSLGKFGVVDSDEPGAIASSLVIVRPKTDRLHPGYLATYFNSKMCKDMISEYENGAAQPNLSAKNLAAFKIALPSFLHQERVVDLASELEGRVDGLIQIYGDKLTMLNSLRQSLLQKAFSGELT